MKVDSLTASIIMYHAGPACEDPMGLEGVLNPVTLHLLCPVVSIGGRNPGMGRGRRMIYTSNTINPLSLHREGA